MISRLLNTRQISQILLDERVAASFATDQTDLDLGEGGSFDMMATAAGKYINSLAGARNGRVITLINVGAYTFYLRDDDGATGTANLRIKTGLLSGAPVAVLPNQLVTLQYSGGKQRWIVQHGAADAYLPETDPVLVAVTGGDGVRRLTAASLLSSLDPGSQKSEARATGGNQTISSTSYTDLTGTSTTFSLAKAALVKVAARATAYGQAASRGTTYVGVGTTWQVVIALDVDGSTYVLGKQRGDIAHDISGGTTLDILSGSGGTVSAVEAISLASGSHTAKLKAKLIAGSNNVTIESVADAPSVVMASW